MMSYKGYYSIRSEEMKLTEKQKKLVEDNVELAYYTANRYMKLNRQMVTRKGLDEGDLIQIASEEMCNSAKRFDPEKSKVATYMTKCMYLKINERVRGYNQIKIPRRGEWKNYQSDIDELILIGEGYLPSMDQTASQSEEGGEVYANYTGRECEEFGKMELLDAVSRVLDEREKKVLMLLVAGAGQIDIGNLIGVSQSRVSRMINQIRRKLEQSISA